MDKLTLYNNYFKSGTSGYLIIRRFYAKYGSALIGSDHHSLNDIIHEIYISLSKTDFKKVQKRDHYIHRAIKLKCWSLLDSAIKRKNVIPESQMLAQTESDGSTSILSDQPSDIADPTENLDMITLMRELTLFKTQLNPQELKIFNGLIDEKSRTELARELNLNLNTTDTLIRRLRIRLTRHLKNRGYTNQILDKFSTLVVVPVYFLLKVSLQNTDLYI